MSSHLTFLVYGPTETLLRMPIKLFSAIQPKYKYEYISRADQKLIAVAVFEQFEKQLNVTSTLTCVIECSPESNRIELYKSGGRMGFRGSSVSDQKSIEAEVVSYISDFSKRMGLTLREEVAEEEKEKEQEESTS